MKGRDVKKTSKANPKFVIHRIDGKPADPKARYFVLRLDPHGHHHLETQLARNAVMDYALKCLAYSKMEHQPKKERDHLAKVARDALIWLGFDNQG